MQHLCHICQLLHLAISDNCGSIYTSYEISVINNVTRSIGINTFHILPYAPKQIGLWHCTYMYHWTTTVAHKKTSHTSKNKQTATSIYHVTAMCAPTVICPSMPHLCQICKSVHVQIWGNYVSIYTSYELHAVNNVIRNTGIHIFHITGIYPWTNMPATMHIYVPLHIYCNLYTDPTLLLHISVK